MRSLPLVLLVVALSACVSGPGSDPVPAGPCAGTPTNLSGLSLVALVPLDVSIAPSSGTSVG